MDATLTWLNVLERLPSFRVHSRMKNAKEPEIELANADVRLAAKDTFRILFLDSVAHTLQLKAACQAAGHSVVSAHTIADAFAFLNGTNHADVVVCAAYLEDESVFEFLKALRKDPLHKSTMFMTLALEPSAIGAKANASTEKTGRLLGADAFVSMPVFDAVRLIAEIKRLLPAVPALEQGRLDKLASDQAAMRSFVE